MSKKINNNQTELPKQYTPSDYEDKIYENWETSGYFNPDNLECAEDAPTYTIILPPPNITDKLHLGHASGLSIQDLLIRYHRMQGYRALWLPGTDHAAIATQNAVEKKLFKEKGITRHDLGRAKFLEEIWIFLKKTQSTILNQTRKMGASLDWSREAFTFDKTRQKAVSQMFIDMYKEGVIYRGERIVNWCPRCKSTLADDEVEYKAQKTFLYTFKYSKDFPFTIATTRPETKLGDTAVAANPKDTRYKEFIGKNYKVDFLGIALNLKIIADREVDMEFGTGALGVTPAHSIADWQMAEKNDLDKIKVINEDGIINKGFGQYSDKTVLETRKLIVESLKENDLLVKEEEIENNLSICYRCDTPIEPLPSRQWFVSVDKKIERLGNKSIKEAAITVGTGHCPVHKNAQIRQCTPKCNNIKFIPERFTKRYTDWMTNLHDWCISRQIWFGHTVPIWHKEIELIEKNWDTVILTDLGLDHIDKNKIPNTILKIYNSKKEEIKLETLTPITPVTEGKYTVYIATSNDDVISTLKNQNFNQDTDTLDTWFSSGMWTFSTLGWPDNLQNGNKQGDLAKFHPTQVLETGYEIITLWVSRMIMMSLFATGEIPFENVYLHGMVLDEHGKKMSKSKGNGIDPIEVINEFGTDAVRLALLIGNTPGNDTRISKEKIASFRNFANKLWNISRFIITNYELRRVCPNTSEGITNYEFDNDKLTISDKWILAKLNNLIKEIHNDLGQYNFSQAGEKLKEFSWNDFADWYLEVSKFEKTSQKSKILIYILENLLKLWHPFMPFVTEVIWQSMGKDKLLMIEKYPIEDSKFKIQNSNQFEIIKNIIIAIRNARAENKVEPGRKIKAIITTNDKQELLKQNVILIQSLRTSISELEIVETRFITSNAVSIENAIHINVDKIQIYLIGARDEEKEKIRIRKEVENLEKLIKNQKKKLANREFVDKAPQNIVAKEREKLNLWEEELQNF